MASPKEWGQIAEWYAETLRSRHPKHFRPNDFFTIRERLEVHTDRNGSMMEMKIAVFEEFTDEQLFQRWSTAFSKERKQNKMIEYHRDMVLFKRACFW
eukprot:2464500-Amphidinium_carterae.1